ncbi:hypothetical protein F2Q69_00043898 [Brassica cretica]|uniref:Uncharacterized protein n=1 Tax=Brassica cretica TaxID=69181 RepID=A0A8S9NII2_BRACR|nr:hypothetical protein F2Q69_00043898 [Brassica cretica]
MVLIFHSFKGFSDLEDFWDDLHVSRLKYNALDDFQEVFQTTSISVVWTSWKSSGLLQSFSDLDLICRIFRSGRLLGRLTCFSDQEDFWDDLPVSRLKYNALEDFQKVFQTTSISVV